MRAFLSRIFDFKNFNLKSNVITRDNKTLFSLLMYNNNKINSYVQKRPQSFSRRGAKFKM